MRLKTSSLIATALLLGFSSAALANDKAAKAAFDAMSKSKQREYADHVASAKQDATKARRLDKVIPMIAAGKGLNDKYR